MSCGKHEGNCDAIITFKSDSPLMKLSLGWDILISSRSTLAGPTMAYRITGWDTLPGGFCELHCELVK